MTDLERVREFFEGKGWTGRPDMLALVDAHLKEDADHYANVTGTMKVWKHRALEAEAELTELREAVKAVPDCECCQACRSMEHLRQLIEEKP